MISIIIPTLNEAENIAGTVNAVSEVPGVEVIVADGGSTDDTVALAGSAGATIVTAPRIRAAQMNAGASAASGAALLFLHADTRLPRDSRSTSGAPWRGRVWRPVRSRCGSTYTRGDSGSSNGL